MKIYIDAGTTYSKVMICHPEGDNHLMPEGSHITSLASYEILRHAALNDGFGYYIIPSVKLKSLNLTVEKACGHMACDNKENEIIALAKGAKKHVEPNSTVLDLGSRDAKWIRFQDGKFHDMDWNTSCASSTGATIEMLLKFYDVKVCDLEFNEEKFVVTCGIFGLEKIMDDISNGERARVAIAKFIHGIAYNAWNFAKKPEVLYLSGGFCENKCFVDSLKKYCEVRPLGRFVLCEGLIDE